MARRPYVGQCGAGMDAGREFQGTLTAGAETWVLRQPDGLRDPAGPTWPRGKARAGRAEPRKPQPSLGTLPCGQCNASKRFKWRLMTWGGHVPTWATNRSK